MTQNTKNDAGPDEVTITVPVLPDDVHPAAGWRRALAGLDPAQRGGYAVIGESLQPGDSLAVAAGTLVLAVDKRTTGWANRHQSGDRYLNTGERYATKDATVTAYVAAGGGLRQLWSRHFKQSRSAFGAASLKKLGALLQEYPAPGGDVRVLREAQRPNRDAGACRWCQGSLAPGTGHTVGRGEDTAVEHFERCPVSRRVDDGAECVDCGRPVCAVEAGQEAVREPGGGWITRHLPYLRCTEVTRPTPQEWAEEEHRHKQALAEAAEEAARQRVRREKRQRKREQARLAREQAERQRAEAEAARVADLAVTATSEKDIADKNLGGGLRAKLVEHTDTLEDGTTKLRWTVTTYAEGSGWTGEDYDPDPGQSEPFTDKTAARATYRQLKFDPDRGRLPVPAGPPCDECSSPGAIHTRCDSSGIEGKICRRCNELDDVMLSFA